MPTAQKQKEFVLCPAGKHILRLKDVEEVEDSKYGGEPRWKWVFTTKETDENGIAYQVMQFTNNRYGNEKASLTLLLDRICPDLDKDEKETLNTDDLIGNKYRAVIKHKPNDAGTMRAIIDYIEPLTNSDDGEPKGKAAKAAPKKRADEEDEDEADPYADE